MECRIATLICIGTCCVCLNVDSKKHGDGLKDLVDTLKYDGYGSFGESQKILDVRHGSESKSATHKTIHITPSERSILRNTFFPNTLCAQWAGLHTNRPTTYVLLYLYRNSTIRQFKIWYPIQICRQLYGNAAIIMRINYSVGFKRQFVRTSTQMCSIICRLISNISTGLPEDCRLILCSQPLLPQAGRTRRRRGQLWPRCSRDVCLDCLCGHFRMGTAYDAVSTTGNRQSSTFNVSLFKYYRGVLEVFNSLKHLCAVFDWQNGHANSFLRHRKHTANEYMKNRCLILKCLPYQCSTRTFGWIVPTDMDCGLCVGCVCIVAQNRCLHPNHAFSWRRQRLEETKRLHLDWKIYYNNSMVSVLITEGTVFYKKRDAPSKLHSKIARKVGFSVVEFLHDLNNCAADHYRTHINTNVVLKKQQVKVSTQDVKVESARGYVSKNQSKLLSIDLRSTTTSITSLVPDLGSGGQAVDLAGMSDSGQHNFNAGTLGQSTDRDYKPVGLDNYPQSSSTQMFDNPTTIQDLQIGNSDAVFQSFLSYFQHTNSSPNSTQEPIIRDTHTVETNRFSLTAQLHRQVNGDTDMAAHFRKRRETGVIVTEDLTVNMAILLPMSQNRLFCMERVSAAIEIAMKRVNKTTCVQWRAESCACPGPTLAKLLDWIPPSSHS